MATHCVIIKQQFFPNLYRQRMDGQTSLVLQTGQSGYLGRFLVDQAGCWASRARVKKNLVGAVLSQPFSHLHVPITSNVEVQ